MKANFEKLDRKIKSRLKPSEKTENPELKDSWAQPELCEIANTWFLLTYKTIYIIQSGKNY